LKNGGDFIRKRVGVRKTPVNRINMMKECTKAQGLIRFTSMPSRGKKLGQWGRIRTRRKLARVS